MWKSEFTNVITKLWLVKDVHRSRRTLKNIVYLQKAISYPFMLVKDQEHKRNSTPLLELKVMAACFSMYGHYQVYIEKGWYYIYVYIIPYLEKGFCLLASFRIS